MNTEGLKKKVGFKVANEITENIRVGLGTGSTVAYLIEALGAKIKAKEIKYIEVVTTSFSSALLAQKQNIPLVSTANISELDLYIDGTDEIDSQKNLIKGRGGSMFQEKLIAEMAKRFIIIADESKKVANLGEHFAVPVEIIPFTLASVQTKLKKLGGTPVLRMAEKKDGPVISDQGNFILDTEFSSLSNWKEINSQINNITGVLGHGLFLSQKYYEAWISKPANIEIF